MNCQEFNRIADADSSSSPDATQSAAMDQHLASCRECRAQWQTWREVWELEVPATPADLRDRIALAVQAERADVRSPRSFKPYVIGGVLVLGLAAAASLIWQADRSAGALLPTTAGSAQVTTVVPSEPPLETSRRSEGPADLQPAVPGSPDPEEEGGTARPLNPRRLLVLLRPEPGADEQALAGVSLCHDAVVSRLRAIPQFEVIADGVAEVGPVDLEFFISPADSRVARAQGAGHVLVFSTTMGGCDLLVVDTGTGLPAGGGQMLSHDGYIPSATSMVQRIREKLLLDRETLWAEARAELLDETLPDHQRAAVLRRLGEYRGGSAAHMGNSAVDSEIIAAAARLATESSEPDVRSGIWAGLRDIDDPRLVGPLLNALAQDPDATVRMQAANTLRNFLDTDGVRDALLRAAAEDPDAVSSHPYYGYSVREAAERAAVPDAQFSEWARQKLHDESLPTLSRLKPWRLSTMDGRILFLDEVEFGAEAARVVFELGRRAQDPDTRITAWDILRRATPDASFVPQWLEDLAGHQDEYVRANAAQLLSRHKSDPVVQAALDKALKDPSTQVRAAASGVQRPYLR